MKTSLREQLERVMKAGLAHRVSTHLLLVEAQKIDPTIRNRTQALELAKKLEKTLELAKLIRDEEQREKT